MEENVVAEQLPDLAVPYELPSQWVDGFRRNGHVKLPGVFSRQEIEAFRPHLNQVVEANSAERHSMEAKVAGSNKNWKFVNNLWALDPVARRFVLSPRLGKIAADLLEVEAVRLFRDQSYFKGPGGSNTPWHQDAYFMPLDTDRILTLWVPLTDITPELAPMSYVSGSHRAGYLGTSNGDDAAMDRFEDEVRAKGMEVFNYGTLAAGDVVAHSAWTLHSSRTNTSPQLREALVIVYYADGARVAVEPSLPKNAPPQEVYACLIRRENRTTSLPGIQPGELAASAMTPLVYSRSQGAAA
jgi:ectoine hydroxylase-related dioxygenase (phytanoyl-CoA dioxygenase family)